MKISDTGIDLIKHYEGFSAKPYKCPAGYMTIGFGHMIKSGEDFPHPLSEGEALLLMRRDIEPFEVAINSLVSSPLKQWQFDALVSFVYNVGIKAFQTSSLLQVINAGDLWLAPKEFLKWIHANKKPLPGLIKRRAAEALLFMNSLKGGDYGNKK